MILQFLFNLSDRTLKSYSWCNKGSPFSEVVKISASKDENELNFLIPGQTDFLQFIEPDLPLIRLIAKNDQIGVQFKLMDWIPPLRLIDKNSHPVSEWKLARLLLEDTGWPTCRPDRPAEYK